MKQFCLRGHDTFVVGRKPSNRQCRACHQKNCVRWKKSLRGTVVSATSERRRYLTDPEYRAKRNARTIAWNRANPERYREHQRKNRLKYRGVNFWIEAAKESV